MPENLLARASREHTPLVDGKTVTFIWQGEQPARLLGDFNGWGEAGPDLHPESAEMRSAGEGLWSVSFELPEDAYVEYIFMEGEERRSDPFNPHKVHLWKDIYNNYLYMPDARPTPYTRVGRGAPRGKVFTETLDAQFYLVGSKRRVHFYQPPVDEACPLLVVWDGQDYLKRAYLPQILDNLIDARRIQPVALAMIENHPKERMVEYGCAEMSLGFLRDRLLPYAREKLNLVDIQSQPGTYGVAGASMGGLMALYAGMRMPDIFGKVLSQSGAFSVPFYDFVVWDLVHALEPRGRRIWMDCGTMEWLTDTNRRMAGLLKERGYTATYVEYRGGHNYTCWRNGLVEGLEWLFPPQG